jgi:hypothetical protein
MGLGVRLFRTCISFVLDIVLPLGKVQANEVQGAIGVRRPVLRLLYGLGFFLREAGTGGTKPQSPHPITPYPDRGRLHLTTLACTPAYPLLLRSRRGACGLTLPCGAH